MKTPYDKECPYFFGDYYRGRNHEECRLIAESGDTHQWTSKLCKNCPVPSIIQANACTNMVLEGKVGKVVLGFGKHMQISAYCKKTNRKVKEPHIGCGECHPLPKIFMEDK